MHHAGMMSPIDPGGQDVSRRGNRPSAASRSVPGRSDPFHSLWHKHLEAYVPPVQIVFLLLLPSSAYGNYDFLVSNIAGEK